VSENLYYLRPNDLRKLVPKLRAALAPGGRLVILHHLKDFDDAAIRRGKRKHGRSPCSAGTCRWSAGRTPAGFRLWR
jgi:hypothetical protein